MKSRMLFAGALILFGVCTGMSESTPQKIDSYLQTLLSSAAPNEFIDAYVVLSDRLSYDQVVRQTAGLRRKVRQQEVVRILKEHSAATRGDVESFLRDASSRGLARNIQVIWAINTISFTATPSVIADLATTQPSVEGVFFDPKHPQEILLDDLGISKYNTDHNIHVDPLYAPQVGLTLINAPLVWAAGDSGQGVLVANIDTGCDWDHLDLRGNIWNNLGEDANGNGYTVTPAGTAFDAGDINGIDNDGNGLIDDLIGWDYVGNDKDPQGGASHGTSTSGLVAGHGAGGTQTGVAPKAKLMILEPSTESNVWVAMQYAIDKGADITTSSLSYKWYFSPQPNYPMWRAMTDLELAAGMVHTNSTSNDGGLFSIAPIPYNISAPGNCPPSWLHPDQTLIGGLSSVIGCGNVEAATDIIATSSPYGPSAWEDIQSVHPTYPFPMPIGYQDYPYETTPAIGLLKPDVSAPGNGTTSLTEGGGYSSFSGTSGATPHVAGTAALLLGANPDLEPADVSRILQTTAVEKGAAGKDARYGAGRIDAYAAYLEAISGGGGIPCGDITSFQYRCVTGSPFTLQFRIVFLGSIAHSGEDVVFDVNGTEYTVTIGDNGTNSRAQMALTGQAAGSYTITLVDPPGCFAPAVVACGPASKMDREWEDFDVLWNDGTTDSQLNTPPAETRILGNYPNPFNPTTAISYQLSADSWVALRIYNTLGEEVATLINEYQVAGYKSATWNGRNITGSPVASGVYIYRLSVGGQVQTGRMLLMK